MSFASANSMLARTALTTLSAKGARQILFMQTKKIFITIILDAGMHSGDLCLRTHVRP